MCVLQPIAPTAGARDTSFPLPQSCAVLCFLEPVFAVSTAVVGNLFTTLGLLSQQRHGVLTAVISTRLEAC